jgi:hypothetical protein
MEKIHFQNAEMLATPSRQQKKPNLLVTKKPVDTKKITDNRTSE